MYVNVIIQQNNCLKMISFNFFQIFFFLEQRPIVKEMIRVDENSQVSSAHQSGV